MKTTRTDSITHPELSAFEGAFSVADVANIGIRAYLIASPTGRSVLDGISTGYKRDVAYALQSDGAYKLNDETPFGWPLYYGRPVAIPTSQVFGG